MGTGGRAEATRLLVTGAAGFIGSSFVRLALREPAPVSALVLDALTYAGNLENLAPVADLPGYAFHRGDICSEEDVRAGFDRAEAAFGGPVDAVVHFAAESHVDRSIEDPAGFLRTNVLGTEVLLRVARERGVSRFLHVSTDEVYGTLGPDDPPFSETTPIAPNSPYAASKAASDLVVRAYQETYGFPALVTRCSNNYGPYQFPEKLIPLMIANALEDRPLPVYGDGRNVRDWIHVDDHSRGILAVLRAGEPGGIYNLGGSAERANIDVVRTLLRLLGKPESLIQYVPDRPGHDRRYAIDSSKARRELAWTPEWTFERGLEATVAWYRGNAAWVASVRSGAYRDYYERMYGEREAWMRRV
ncbi:MAG: dTDP-glucose 4,6-dehydratase [Chthonomonadales bacterium]|nr:dTDP-glucose 4,6-dehydratase [Chthonomonadales bacterium]